jgi:thioesterase domain-containing protein
MAWLPAELPDGLSGALALLQAERDLDGMLAVCQRAGLLPMGIDVLAMRRHLSVWYGIDYAVRHYQSARPLSAPPHVFVASDEVRSDPELGWNRRQTPPPVIVLASGGHYSMVKPPHAGHLGEAISIILQSL